MGGAAAWLVAVAAVIVLIICIALWAKAAPSLLDPNPGGTTEPGASAAAAGPTRPSVRGYEAPVAAVIEV